MCICSQIPNALYVQCTQVHTLLSVQYISKSSTKAAPPATHKAAVLRQLRPVLCRHLAGESTCMQLKGPLVELTHQERLQAAQALAVMTTRQLNRHSIVQHLNAMTSLSLCCLQHHHQIAVRQGDEQLLPVMRSLGQQVSALSCNTAFQCTVTWHKYAGGL